MPAAAGSREAVGTELGLAQGLVRSTSGKGIAGARVTWTALRKEDVEKYSAWRLGGFGLPPRTSLETTTDAKGEFRFERSPEEVLSHGSVIIAMQPGYRPNGRDLPPGLAGDNLVLTLAEEESVHVRVVDDLDRPVGGAWVSHVGEPRGNEAAGEELPLHARFLSTRAQTDGNGELVMARFPGEQAFWAEHGALISLPWRGSSPTRVVLRLVPGFELSGSVSILDPEEWSPDYAGERRIVVLGRTGSLWRPVTALRGVQVGPFGPLRVPLADFDGFCARLEGAPVVPQVLPFDPPRAGAEQRLDFVAEKGLDLYLLVEDENEKPLPSATATAWPGPGLATLEIVEGTARPDGYVYLGTFRPGTVGFSASAPGYAATEGRVELPTREAQWVGLTKGGRIEGQCTSEGNAVSDFEVVHWRNDNAVVPRSRAFFDRADGSFQLEGLAPGDWSLQAADASHPAGNPVVVTVRAGETATVALELYEGLVGHGTILDAASGAPIAGAAIQAHASGGMELGPAWGAPARSRSDGTFELRAFVPGSNFVSVSAEGFASAERKAVGAAGVELAWGEIRLTRPQTLRLTLLGLADLERFSPSDLRAYTVQGHILPERRFDAEGHVAFEGVPAGDHELFVGYPDQSYVRLHLRLDPGVDWDFAVGIAGPGRLDVRVETAEAEPPAPGHTALVAATEENGVFTLRAQALPDDGTAHFEGLRANRAQVLIASPDNQIVATREVGLGDGPRATVLVRLGETPLRVHVLDREGAPLPSAWVTLRSASGHEIHGIDDTDAAGWASLFGAPAGAVLMDVVHGIHGRRFGIPVDAAQGEIEFVLEATGALELELRDGEEPLMGVEARLETTSGVTLSEVRQSDSQGLVRFDGLGEGNYRVGLRSPGCWPATLERSLSADERARVPVPMRRLSSLELSVIDARGFPVAGLPVELHSSEFDAPASRWLAEGSIRAPQGLTTDALGKLVVEGLPRGPYVWTVATSSGSVSGGLELSAKEPNRAVARLP